MLFSLKSNHFIGAVFTACALMSAGISTGTQAAWQQSLTDAEIQALELSVGDRTSLQRQGHRLDTSHPSLGLEVLLIELQEKKSQAAESPRLAEVFVFDYTTSSTSVILIEVDTHKVVSSRSIDNIHLPLNEREITAALQWLLVDTELIEALRLEYEKQIGKALDSLDQVDMKVSIWNPGAGRDVLHECNQSRCALVSLFTRNYYNFSVEPVVNLATGKISLDLVQ